MLNQEILDNGFKKAGLPYRVIYLQEVDSTNGFARHLIRTGNRRETVICTDFQTAGRGRLQRQWHSRPGENLLFSILLYPGIDVNNAQRITLAVAVIMYRQLREFCRVHIDRPLEIDVKWPNDLLVNGKKICGILTESVLKDTQVDALIVGIGVNVRMNSSGLPAELRNRVISLTELCEKPVQRADFLISFLDRFRREYHKMLKNGFADAVSEWKDISRQIGRPIRVQNNGEMIPATFVDLDERGCLIYQTENGKKDKLVAGDVEWL